jgi:acyl carrier protein
VTYLLDKSALSIMDETWAKIVALCALAIAAVTLCINVGTLRLRRKIERVFFGRQSLTPLQFHQQYFAEQEIAPDISTAVRDILQSEFCMDMSRLSAEDAFDGSLSFILNNDDLLDVAIIESIEKRFDIKIDDEAATQVRTVRDLVVLVHSTLKATSNG